MRLPRIGREMIGDEVEGDSHATIAHEILVHRKPYVHFERQAGKDSDHVRVAGGERPVDRADPGR